MSTFETHCHDCRKELERLSFHEPHICYECDMEIDRHMRGCP